LKTDPKRRLELARLLSSIDRLGSGESFPEVKGARPIGSAFRIGITGPIGAGKSTLINRLAHEFRNRDRTVGIIAVDPSSPFTGGAVLGDRIRMADLALDEGIFIRSLATRGAFGGLAESAVDAADLIDMFGFDRIIIETVGVGQTEVDIVEACDMTVVVLEPSSGDSVQAIKAGLMEIADLFVVNKMDMRSSQRFVADLETTMALKNHDNPTKVLPVQSRSGDGITELCSYLDDHFEQTRDNAVLRKRRTGQRAKRIRRIAEGMVMQKLWKHLDPEVLERVVESGMSVREAAWVIVDELVG